AFRVLSNSASLKMAELLKLDRPPGEHERCLTCHVAPSSKPTALVEQHYGVGCEACHGSAKNWLALHSAAGWKDRSAAAKKELGMTPMGDTRAVAEQCVSCHVGSGSTTGMKTRDVNHDLIAAGHPRLNFEFTAYLDNLPRHWKEKHRSAKERTAAYVSGQLV